MSNSFVVSRNHLIFGLCLPAAVLLGYLLAEPQELGSVAAILLIVSALLFPLVLKWHHLLLAMTWNATITPYFLPGRPALWMVMAAISLLIALLGRSVSLHKRLINVPAITQSLMFLLAVVVVTGLFTGGFGLRMLGSESYGGKGYFFIAFAILGYFALSSQAIPRHRANLYVALFTLSGITSIVSNLAYLGGSKFYFLYEIFPAELAMDQAVADWSIGEAQGRISGAGAAAEAVFGFLLARYGARGVLDIHSPWRLVLFLGSIFVSMLGGFRSVLLFLSLIFVILFIIEGLWKTRLMVMAVGVFLVCGVVIVGFVDRLPQPIQRTLSFLPINVDPGIKEAARTSTEWRLEMWKLVLPDVPKYLFKGKGYALDPAALYMATEARAWKTAASYEASAFAGDYHNGPLSIVIPFGIYGVIALLWFWGVGVRVLWNNFKYGDPSLNTVNGYLLALFIVRIFMFCIVFGAFSSGLFYFTGILGLSVALNHGERRPGTEFDTNTD